MTADPAPRRADAQRNVEATLDAGLAVLGADPNAGIGEIAGACGLTRTTVCAHFPGRERLLDALVGRAMAAAARVDAGTPEHGPPQEALRRVLAASWEQLNRHRGVGVTAAKALGVERWPRTTPPSASGCSP